MSELKTLFEESSYRKINEPGKKICDSCIHSTTMTNTNNGEITYKKIYCKNLFQVVFESTKLYISDHGFQHITNTRDFTECSGYQKNDKSFTEIKKEIDRDLDNEIDKLLNSQGE